MNSLDGTYCLLLSLLLLVSFVCWPCFYCNISKTPFKLCPFIIYRYARWSLGFVDPPLSVIGTGSHCTISALNKRGQVLLSPILSSMNKLLEDGTLSNVNIDGDVISVEVSKAGEVGSFSEEERSRQVSYLCLFCCC